MRLNKNRKKMKILENKPKITLVGAGPGDIELITLKGIKAIKSADVILYDALVNEELLDFAPNAIKIFVGKRRGFKVFSQEEINQLIVDQAFLYGHVVRLKGGDSFVFGRGYEEILHAEAFNIPTSVVPGISSSISVPALAGIPVTHRGVSNSFFVLTGTLSDGSINPEIEIAAQSSATVVILMGLSKLQEITEVYKRQGKSDEAVAVISNGSLSNQISVVGTIDTIAENTINIPAPGVIVIGPVVELSNVWKDKEYLFDLLKF
jgi:uroporphyrin-III C-methyltransferase